MVEPDVLEIARYWFDNVADSDVKSRIWDEIHPLVMRKERLDDVFEVLIRHWKEQGNG